MADFKRAWEITIRDNLTKFPILNFNQENSLRMQFAITSAPGVFLTFGTIKIYNIPYEKLGRLHYRSLRSGITKGPLYELAAGYPGDSSIFSAGSVHNCYSTVTGAGTVTTFEVGLSTGNSIRNLQRVEKVSLTSPAGIAVSVQAFLKNAFTLNGVQLAPLSKRFIANCQTALSASGIAKLDYALTPTGSINSIINYLNTKLKIVIFRDTRGAIDVRPAESSNTAFIDNTIIPAKYSTKNDGFSKLVIGTPYDQISGVKFRAFINPGLKFFQRINFESKFINRAISVQQIETTGDTRSEIWYNDIYGINYNIKP